MNYFLGDGCGWEPEKNLPSHKFKRIAYWNSYAWTFYIQFWAGFDTIILYLFVEKEKRIIENVSLIEEEVKNHDVLFLLTDTRESRWLPTVLANKFNKVCLFYLWFFFIFFYRLDLHFCSFGVWNFYSDQTWFISKSSWSG